MALEIASQLGPYKVTAKIGEGGMGEVYRARDTKLDRDVALKVLPAAFTQDPDRLARFEREAKVLASLNHPNIAAIYGLEEAGDTRALVLELVEGPTLADRIAKGPIPLDEALPIAKQITEALEAAHEAGVIHRDLKPANIKVREDGTVKVLDFGLAKALDPTPEGDPSQSPTLTAAATQMGVIMGTAAYMSPEQARGKPVDKRADIWAFGCVLFEMLTAKKAFEGEDVSTTLASVLQRDPDWHALPAGVTGVVEAFLRRSLDKDPRRRLHDVADMRLAIEGAFQVGVDDELPDAPAPLGWKRAVPTAAAASVIGGVITGLAAWLFTSAAPEIRRVSRFGLVFPTRASVAAYPVNHVALSPTGTHVAYAGYDQLYVRAIDELEARPVQSSDGAIEPFFSADGRWLGFWADGYLKKVPVDGGPPVTICAVAGASTPSWGPDDTIFFTSIEVGIMRVDGAGGTPEAVIRPAVGELALGRPQLLPGGEWLLFRIAASQQIVIQSLVTGERKVLMENGGDTVYLPTGHLAYVLDGTLLAVPFDVRTHAITGGGVPLIEGIRQQDVGFVAHVGYAADGTLIYEPGTTGQMRQSALVWLDRHGNEEPLPFERRAYDGPRLSPDGRRFAVAVREDGNQDIWLYDLERGIRTRLTFHPGDDAFPLWSIDGSEVVFSSTRDGSHNLYSKAADGTGAIRRLTASAGSQMANAFAPDRTLVITEGAESVDLGILTDGNEEPTWLLQAEHGERLPSLSPDGRWLAYVSNESGVDQIYARPFPNVNDGRWQISTGLGISPRWSAAGDELYYQSRDNQGGAIRMMAVPIDTDQTLSPGTARVLFDGPYRWGDGFGANAFDVASDERFLMIRDDSVLNENEPAEVTIVLNWFEELKERVPVP